jgi:diguanylate cyclase (GGDEF)-like protein
VFRVITVLTLLNTVAFGVAVSLDHPWPPAVRWLPLPIIIGLAAHLSRRVQPNPAAPPAVHRYWQISTAGLAVFAVTAVLRLVDAIGVGLPLLPLSIVTHIAGGVLMTYPLVKLPLDTRGRRSNAGVLLDVGTLMIAAAVLILHFATMPLVGDGRLDTRDLLSAGTILIAGLGTVHTNARIALTGVPWISRRALQSIGLSGVVGGLGSAVGLLLPLPMNTSILVLLLPLAAYAAAVSARFQLTEIGRAAEPRPRRSYSLMPYLAAGIVCGMLVVTAATDAPDHLYVVGFAVLIVVLVIIRQLVAFRQNDELLRRIGLQEKEFRVLATHDPLTGLANRALFADRLSAAVSRGERPHGFSIVLIDLDDFKTVNDTLGHAVGDALLVHVSQRLRSGVRPADTVARLGGDEFAILFEDISGESAGHVLDRLAGALLEPAVIEGEPLAVRASFGLVDGHPGDDAGELLRQADIAMYDAKEQGEGGHRTYRPGMEARGAERRKLTTELRTAIDADQLVVHYQPVVRLPDGRITGAEALVRWQHPER